MSHQVQRIQNYCETIWGPDDYEIDTETDDYEKYQAFVKKDYGDSYGPLLTMTPICNSNDRAWNELERMLALWAVVAQSGQPMTKDQRLKIFGGPNGEHKHILQKFSAEAEKRGEAALIGK